MKKLAASLLSASCLVLISTAAEAQQRWPNWYVGLNTALTFVGEENVGGHPVFGDLDADSGFGYGASIGYRPQVQTGEWSSMRIEVAWQHQRSDIDTASNIAGGASRPSGDLRVNAGMFNVFYDAATSMASWRPYVGVGVGFADVHLQNADPAFLLGNDSDSVFAWNLMAGLGYIPEWLPYTEWSFGYRYFATSDAEFTVSNGARWDLEYDSHNIEAGMKFLF